jgi:hypothetical protein
MFILDLQVVEGRPDRSASTWLAELGDRPWTREDALSILPTD